MDKTEFDMPWVGLKAGDSLSVDIADGEVVVRIMRDQECLFLWRGHAVDLTTLIKFNWGPRVASNQMGSQTLWYRERG